MNNATEVRFSPRQLYLGLWGLLIVNLLFLTGSGLTHELLGMRARPLIWFILQQVYLASENVAAAWYSSMLLLLVAIGAIICFYCDRQEQGGRLSSVLNYGWLGFSAIFVTLSLDEMGSFHELIGETDLFRSVGFGSGRGWNAFLLLIAVVAFYMIAFYLTKINISRRSFICFITGTFLFLSNPIQEHIEISAYHSASDPDNWRRPTSLLLLEEGSEIFGALCFFAAMIFYAVDRSRKLRPGQVDVNIRIPFNYAVFLCSVVALVVMAFVAMSILYLYADTMVKGDDGIAENWFPSALFFILAIVGCYRGVANTLHQISKRDLLLAASALMYSGYFGSNLYAHELMERSVLPGLSVNSLYLIFNICVGGLLCFLFRSECTRAFIFGFMALVFLQLWETPVPVPFAGYLSACLLLGAIISEHLIEGISSGVPTATA
jgi:hypothetical protein